MNPVTQDWGGLKGLVSWPRPRSNPSWEDTFRMFYAFEAPYLSEITLEFYCQNIAWQLLLIKELRYFL